MAVKLNFKKKPYLATVVLPYGQREHILVDKRLRRKLNRLSRKFGTFDVQLLNTNKLLLQVGNYYPFKLDRYKYIRKDQKQYSNLLLPLPTKITTKELKEKLEIQLEVSK